MPPQEPVAARSPRTFADRRALHLVVAAAFVVRAVYWGTKWTRTLKPSDAWYYSGQARQILHGVWFHEIFSGQPGAEHGPLTSLLMAPLSFGDTPHRWQRLVTVATGVLAVWAIGRMVEEMAGRRAGLVAAGLAAFYPNLWMADGLVMSESVSVLFVVLSLWAAWRAVGADDHAVFRRRMAWLGLWLGLGMLSRSELVMLTPLVLGWVVVVRARSGQMAWRRPRAWAGVAIGVAVILGVLAPWVTFNVVRFSNPVVLTTNDGTALQGANCYDTYYGERIGGWELTCVNFDPAFRLDEEPSERTIRQRKAAFTYVRDHWHRVPVVVAARVARTFAVYGLDSILVQDTGEERPRWAVWAGIVSFWLLAVVGAVSWRLVARRVRTLLATTFVVTLFTSAAFYGANRVRSSAEPAIVALVAIGVAAWWDRRTVRGAAPGEPGVTAASAGR